MNRTRVNDTRSEEHFVTVLVHLQDVFRGPSLERERLPGFGARRRGESPPFVIAVECVALIRLRLGRLATGWFAWIAEWLPIAAEDGF